jgi:long-subunit acyl-CoA synthetase (AMP-forming)
MSSSFLSVLIQRQAGKYGDRVALRYRDYKTETWIPVSWNQFAATVKTVSNALIELGIGIQEFVLSVGINMVAGYGLTESTATVACENDNDHVVGSVGRIMPHVQVRIGSIVTSILSSTNGVTNTEAKEVIRFP